MISQVIHAGLTTFLVFTSVLVLWQPNTEPDLAGYRIYYGLSSRDYQQVVDVGKRIEHVIDNLLPGNKYYFAVTAYDSSGNESVFSDEVNITLDLHDSEFTGSQESTLQHVYNFPNPMRLKVQNTQIRYYLAESGKVSIEIYDMNGLLVKTILLDELKNAGVHTEDFWDGKNEEDFFVSSGVYICKIRADRLSNIIRIVTIR